MTRKPYSTEPTGYGTTRYVSQPVDPVSGRRIRLTAESPEELATRTARVREVRRDVAFGMPPEQAKAKLRPALGRHLTIKAVWESWLVTTARQNQRNLESLWRTRLARWLDGRRAWDVDATLLARWEAELSEEGLSAGSIWAAFDCLKAAFRRRIPRELPGLPWGDWHPHAPRRGGREAWEPARPAVRSFDEAIRLLEAGKAEQVSRPSHAFVALAVALLTGLRQAELAGLRWDDLEIEADRPLLLRVRRQAPKNWHRNGDRAPSLPPKGKRERRQALHPQAAEVLRQWRDVLTGGGLWHPLEPVFPSPKSSPVTGRWRRGGVVLEPAAVQRWAAAAGLRDPESWGAHSLRHSFVTLEVVSSGGNLRATQLRAGHSDARMTQAYLHQLGADLPQPAVPMLPMGAMPALLAAGETAPPPSLIAGPEEGRTAEGGAGLTIARDRSFAESAAETEGLDPPPDVLRKARAAYSKAYKRATREGADPAAAREAGMRSRRATLGAWCRLRKRLAGAEVNAK